MQWINVGQSPSIAWICTIGKSRMANCAIRMNVSCGSCIVLKFGQCRCSLAFRCSRLGECTLRCAGFLNFLGCCLSLHPKCLVGSVQSLLGTFSQSFRLSRARLGSLAH